ncbi:CHAT domain-containing protein [Streptomyces phaeolivaceus]|uniref:CHAT domain-containing protein n=1 Tax=Streptomyces phaeolivaceus TaxID=2653200 RepID=A0A5P8K8U3_9ACTN|nr:CHAT domain-containing protein [Streptomyces phaeolivaceus]QFQ99440.1 CHAT domain-containing protein [Streptomyces phaeolivaceus]
MTRPPLVESLRAAVHRHDRKAADRAVAGLLRREAEVRRTRALDNVAVNALGAALALVSPRRLNDTIVLLVAAVENVTPPDSFRIRVLLPFLTRLFERATASGEPEALDALLHLTEALERIPNERPEIQVLTGFYRAQAWLQRYASDDGTLSDLDGAVTALRATEQRASTRAPEAMGRLEVLELLASSLALRGELTDSGQDIDDAVDTAERALELARRTEPARCSEHQAAVARNLSWRYERCGRSQDLDRAQPLAEQALAVDRDNADRLRLLGDVLRQRGVAEVREDTLRRAIGLLRKAVEVSPADPDVRASLALAVAGVYDLTDDSRELRESLALQRSAVRDTPRTEPVRARYLCTLGVGLTQYFERYGDLDSLDESIETLRDGLATAGDEHPVRPALANALATALECRSRTRRGKRTDLPKALELQHGVVTSVPVESPRRAEAVTGLSLLLRQSQRVTGKERQATRLGEQMLDEIARTGTFTLPPVLPSGSGDPSPLREAVRLARSALADTPAGGAQQAVRLTSLGQAQAELFEATKDPADRARAVQTLATATRSSTASAHIRAIAGRSWGRLAADAADWASAAEAYGAAVKAYAALGDSELERGDQEFNLRSYRHFASNAAASELRYSGDAAAALEVLEAGRGVLLARALDDGTGPASSARSPSPGAREPVSVDLAPPRVAESGPLVAVNVSEYGCHALLVTTAGVSTVPLPDLTTTAVEERAEAFLTALHILAGGDRFDPLDAQAAGRFVNRTLGWLWDTVAEPVLTALGLADAPHGAETLPRLWLMPTGPLGVLPLHAAGHHTAADRRTLLDRAVPSYTTTVRALVHSRRRIGTGSGRPPIRFPVKPLAVCVPRLPDAPELPAAEWEVASLRTRLTGLRELREGDARRADVRTMLAQSDWVHFACHATSNLDQPSASRLHLADGPLSVADLTAIRAPDAFLAYLSACGTGRPGVNLPDEVIHMSSAFHMIGYPHVVSTLWPVGDRAAATIADDVYKEMLVEGTEPARAVHAAVRNLRDTNEGYRPTQWASHIHTGP